MPEVQYDGRLRVVALANLLAMCAHISGMCHTYRVREGRDVVYVTYSNPNEYGRDRKITITLPIVYRAFGAAMIGLAPECIGRMTGPGCGTWQGEEWQAFDPLFTCPELWRGPAPDVDWRTREQIEAAKVAT